MGKEMKDIIWGVVIGGLIVSLTEHTVKNLAFRVGLGPLLGIPPQPAPPQGF